MTDVGTPIVLAEIITTYLRQQQIELAFGYTVKIITLWRRQKVEDSHITEVLKVMLQSIVNLPSYNSYCLLLKEFASIDLQGELS